MIIYKQADILHAPEDVLVCPVNCVGVMGQGLALQFAKLFPDSKKFYEAVCNGSKWQKMIPGVLARYDENGKTIIFFPTKTHWRYRSRYSYVETGLDTFKKWLTSGTKNVVGQQHKEFKSIAIPALGCGLGTLDWKRVKLLVENYLIDLPYDVTVYEYIKTLSKLEGELLAGLADGKTAGDLAKVYKLNTNDVYYLLARIYKKLGAKTSAQAVAIGIQNKHI